MKRVGINILIFISIIVLPWWLTGIFLIAFIVFEKNPYELLFFALFMDSLYGTVENGFFHLGWTTLIAAAVFILSYFVKERILLYNTL